MLEKVLLGLFEIASIMIGILLIWKVSITRKLLVEMILYLIFPSISILVLFGNAYGIICFLFGISLFAYQKTKSAYSLLDICLLLIGGILSDQLSQLIVQIVEQNIHFLSHGALLTLYIVGYYLFRRKVMPHVPLSLFIVLLLAAIVTVINYYALMFLLDEIESALHIVLTLQAGYFICLLLLFMIVLKHMKKEHQLQQKATELAQFSHYMFELEQVNNDMHKFRHDYQHILLTIQGYLQDNNMDELRSYFKDEILHTHKYTLMKSTQYNNLEHIEDLGMKGLLAAKLLQAQERNIQINLEIPDRIEAISMSTIDLARIIGIFFDNAFEQCELESIKEINFAFMKTSGSTILVIQNPLTIRTLSVSQMYKKGVSSKGDNRGLGLCIAKELINQYPNCTLHTRIENSYFIQELQFLHEEY